LEQRDGYGDYTDTGSVARKTPGSPLTLDSIVTIGRNAAGKTPLSSADLHALRIQLVIEAGAAVLVLLVATTLSMYKPKGMTRCVTAIGTVPVDTRA
jgi:hypothetical protein